MYFKRISDLHPLDATTIISGTDSKGSVVQKSQYYDLDTLWVEVSQTVITAEEAWTPVSSSPTYVSGTIVSAGDRIPASNYETLSSTDGYISRRCSLAEVFKNVGDLYTTYLTSLAADLSFISSYYIEGKHTNKTLYVNLPGSSIKAISSLSATALTGNINNIANDLGAAVTINNTGLTAKQVHSQYQFSVNYTAALSSDVGTGVSANSTGLTASNITIPGVANLTAAAAYWADLAELYRADNNYAVGTLVKFGGEAEVTIADDFANAVVTDKPAYLMNSGLKDGTEHPVGLVLTGRSKVRVIGPICKFDRLGLSDKPGIACRVSPNYMTVIGIALETNLEATEKLVEATLKLTF